MNIVGGNVFAVVEFATPGTSMTCGLAEAVSDVHGRPSSRG
jgi:hypothetical protein